MSSVQDLTVFLILFLAVLLLSWLFGFPDRNHSCAEEEEMPPQSSVVFASANDNTAEGDPNSSQMIRPPPSALTRENIKW